MPGYLEAEISHTYVVNRGICPRHSDINTGHRQTHDLYSSAKTSYAYEVLVEKHDDNMATTKTEA